MRLSVSQRATVRALLASESHSFVELTEAAGLERATDFIEADLRGIDFGTDDLARFDFTRAHFEGANLTCARGLERANFKDARWDAATRGLLLRDFPGGPQMVLIPPGSFVMGVPPEESEREQTSNYDDNARPQHPVRISRPFYLGRYPVTRGQFAAFVKAENYAKAGEDWRKPHFRQNGAHPVVNVSHGDAEAYAEWLCRKTGKEYRLCSEAEWEYATRAGTTTARFWGDGRDEACRYANVADETLRKSNKAAPDPDRYFECEDGFARTSPVGSFLPNAFGLYDMLGNVWEWTADHWHDSYDNAPDNGSAWTTQGSAARRVLRGGSWGGSPRVVRAGFRNDVEPGIRGSNAGFRLARTL